MKTAVQLRVAYGGDLPRTELLCGARCEVARGALGPVALFAPGELVAYLVVNRRRRRLFVFRTLDVDDVLAATLPGVRPRVRLLIELKTAGRVRLVRMLLDYLARSGRDPSTLPDGFYVRVGAALGGRLPTHKILRSLLDPFPAPRAS
jgi:hypothetical protein